MNNHLIKSSAYFLGLSLLIGACAKDNTEPSPSNKTSEINHSKPTLPDQPGHIAELELSTDLDLNLVLENDEPRSLNFTMGERVTGETGVPAFRPYLDLQDPEGNQELSIPIYTIIAKKGDLKSVFTQELIFRKKRGSNIIYYSGLASLPQGQDFEQGEWYMMLLANHNPESTRSTLAPSYSSHTSASYALPVRANYNGKAISVKLGVPYVSEWFRIEYSSHKSNHIISKQSFQLKPEGILIQHELVGDLAEAHQLRAVGIRSNTLSFSGYYDTTPAAIIQTLNKVTDSQTRILPNWVATPQPAQEFSRVWDNTRLGKTSLFPWSMPSPKDSQYHRLQSNAQLAASSQGDHSLQVLSPQTSTAGIPQAWEVRGRQYVFFWAMPQEVVAGEHPYTYIYADVMHEADGRSQSYTANPQELHSNLQAAQLTQSEALDKLNEAYYYAAALRYAINKGDNDGSQATSQAKLKEVENKLPVLEQAYSNSLASLRATQVALEDFNRSYMAQAGLSRQTTLVTYANAAQSQVNGTTIKTGRIYQSKGLISPDLLITELVYKYDNGQNYSLVEISNPAQSPRDLRDYALVRLKEVRGSYFYQTEGGSTTASLTEAKKLLLADLPSKQEDEARYSPIAPTRAWTFSNGSTDKYPAQSRFWWNSLSEPTGAMPLYSQQSILLGASGYITDPVLRVSKSSISSYEGQDYQNYRCSRPKDWFAQWLGAQGYTTAEMPQPSDSKTLLALMHNARLRYMVAYDNASLVGSGHSTLDLLPGEGIALLKKTAEGNWQLIDSSVPIGANAWASSMSAAEYKALITAHTGDFSLQRQDYLAFPCLPPYRSAKVHGKGSEWVAKPINEHSLGHRGKHSSVRYQFEELWSLTNSMLSPTKRPIAPQIPVTR